VGRFSDKQGALRRALDALGVRYRDRSGWQPVRCPNRDAHSRGDRRPSASVNLELGRFRCHACGLAGDGYDLCLLAGITHDGGPSDEVKDEETWLL